MAGRPGSTVRVPIVEVRGGQRSSRSDEVAVEEPLEVRVVAWVDGRWDSHPIAVTMRTPGHDFELAAGFLFTEGVIPHRGAVRQVAYCTDPDVPQHYNVVNVYLEQGVPFDPHRFSRNVYTTSSCGVCGKTSLEAVRAICRQLPVGAFRLSHQFFPGFLGALRGGQALFSRTGGLHASALFDGEGRLLLVREDVGRHNAMDKLVGTLLLEDRVPAGNTVVVVSGRASFELAQKALAAGIPVLAAVGAPSSLAVDLAREFSMTLVGFLRDGRFNVYAGAERLLVG